MNITSSTAPDLRRPKAGSAGTGLSEDEVFSDAAILELLRRAVKHDELDIFAQPVVTLPGRKTCFYELYGRVRAKAGASIPAHSYLSMARENNIVAALDKIILLKCLQHLHNKSGGDKDRSEDIRTGYIINVGSTTLKDAGFMDSLLNFIARNRSLAAGIVFEMHASDYQGTDRTMGKVLDALSMLGCRFSMDHLEDGEIDAAFLKRNHIGFIKVDAGRLVGEAASEKGLVRVRRIRRELESAGIQIIAEKIETAGELRELLDLELNYGQGYHLGKPDYFSSYTRKKINDNKHRKEKETYVLTVGNKRSRR